MYFIKDITLFSYMDLHFTQTILVYLAASIMETRQKHSKYNLQARRSKKAITFLSKQNAT